MTNAEKTTTETQTTHANDDARAGPRRPASTPVAATAARCAFRSSCPSGWAARAATARFASRPTSPAPSRSRPPSSCWRARTTSRTYAWGGKTARRYFCKICGVHCFARGYLAEVGGDYVSINLNAIDDIEVAELPLVYWDGRHNNWYAGTRATPWSVFASPPAAWSDPVRPPPRRAPDGQGPRRRPRRARRPRPSPPCPHGGEGRVTRGVA